MSKYLITGGAGFIGSNIVEELLRRGEQVRILDNFATGYEENINEAYAESGATDEGLIEIFDGDIRDFETCEAAVEDVDYVIHCAALGSVPRSIEVPLLYNEVNITGTLNMLEAAHQEGVKRFVYSASSAAYGDTPTLPKIETMIPSPKSPYAITKLVGEYYCKTYMDVYGLETISLRYFNVFGKRQDPESQYAAVIPKFVNALLDGKQATIYGDGEQTRDFTYVANVVQANLNACTAPKDACGRTYNIGYGERTSLNQLYNIISELVGSDLKPKYDAPRAGDVKDSLASIDLAREFLNYQPVYNTRQGLEKTVAWYRDVY